MSDKSQNPDDIEEFSGLNRIFKSKAIQWLINKIGDGSFSEFFDDWKWIFTFSKKYAKMIIFLYHSGRLQFYAEPRFLRGEQVYD